VLTATQEKPPKVSGNQNTLVLLCLQEKIKLFENQAPQVLLQQNQVPQFC
jgi:hypothetical protein